MNIFGAAVLLSLAAATPSEKLAGPSTTAAEEHLVTASIADLRGKLPDPRAARFRRVHFFVATGQDGTRRTLLCGQVWADDPRMRGGWTMFGAAEIQSGFYQVVGEMAVRWCDQPAAAWDYSRDFAARYASEVSGKP